MKKRALSLLLVLMLLLMSSCSLTGNSVSKTYDEALDAIMHGNYTQAVNKLENISFYEDSAKLSVYCEAHAKAAEGDYYSAINLIRTLGSYRDAEQCNRYFMALDAEFSEFSAPITLMYAVSLYESEDLNSFRDSSSRALAIRQKLYNDGKQAEENGDWSEACKIFKAMGSYEDCALRFSYSSGRVHETGEKGSGLESAYAVSDFSDAGDYLDAKERKELSLTKSLEIADAFISEENFEAAEKVYDILGDFCDPEKLTALEEAKIEAVEKARLQKIENADALCEAGLFDEAKGLYLDAGESDMANEAMYKKAAFLVEHDEPEEGAALYLSLNDYKDSRERHFATGVAIMESSPDMATSILLSDKEYPGAMDKLYEIAVHASENKNYELSISIYSEFQGVRDCALRMTNDLYLYGLQLLEEDSPNLAASIFENLSGVGSSALYADMARYAAAASLEESGTNYLAAAEAFARIREYADAAEREKECRYHAALSMKELKDYSAALEIFLNLGKYEDCMEQALECQFLMAEALQTDGQYHEAISLYLELDDFHDSKEKVNLCYQLQGRSQLNEGNAEEAYESFSAAHDSYGMEEAAFAVAESKVTNMMLEEALHWYKLAPTLPETEERTAMIAQHLLNMDEDKLAEDYASVIEHSEKSHAVFYSLALRSLERKDEASAMRQMKIAGDYEDASERFQSMLKNRVASLVQEGNYDAAASLCASYDEQESANQVLELKSQNEEVEKKRALEEAEKLLLAGEYDEAIRIYKALDELGMVNEVIYQKAIQTNQPDLFLQILDYKDSREKHYLAGMDMISSNQERAFMILAGDVSYKDTRDILYNLANQESEKQNYYLSSRIFKHLAALPLDPQDMKTDCAIRYHQDMYQYGIQLQDQGNWESAIAVFGQVADIGEAKEHILECRYNIALLLEDEGNFSLAAVAFDDLDAYKDSAERVEQNRYNAAKKLMDSGELDEAKSAFMELGQYSDANEMAMECSYQKAILLFSSGEIEEAQFIFAELGSYADANEKHQECVYQIALDAITEGNYDSAISMLSPIVEYRDVASLLAQCHSQMGSGFINVAEKSLVEGKTSIAIEGFQSAYYEFVKADNVERSQELANQIGDCYYSMSNLDAALEWYRLAGLSGVTKIADMAQYALNTEQYELAENLLKESEALDSGYVHYRLGSEYEHSGDYVKAIEHYLLADGINDANQRVEELLLDPLSGPVLIGASLYMGSYTQDEEGIISSPIEWIVLSVDGHNATLLSKYGIEMMRQFNSVTRGQAWGESLIRKWLNNNFIENAFIDEERDIINISIITYHEGSNKRLSEDKIYLLDLNEVDMLTDKRCEPTAYVKSRYANIDEYAAWWLRSQGTARLAFNTECVDGNGTINERYNNSSALVRPAMAIDIYKYIKNKLGRIELNFEK